ncbi:MAG: hypothetical protein IJZ90_01105 [Clostridia bacterium]|nr:hypothetical protein [Clostridia bacterium]
MVERFVSFLKKADKTAFEFFSGCSAWTKSLIAAGMLSSIVVAVCAVCAAVYLMAGIYSETVNDIIDFCIDRSAALPAISMFFCIISEIVNRSE